MGDHVTMAASAIQAMAEPSAPATTLVAKNLAATSEKAAKANSPEGLPTLIPRVCILENFPLDTNALSVYSVYTEITDMAELTGLQKQYILHWGEMGTKWGINRTVAQIHALLYLSPEPVPAEKIAETLSVARSNVSTSIRELETWGIVRAVHVLGDRREHYESMKDVWEMFRLVIEQRKRREIDPTREMLRRCLAELDPKEPGADYTRQRLEAMAGFFEAITELHDQMKRLPTGTVRKLLRMGTKIRKKAS
jgi:DNA-binding transcriptional regulator GbsR (MarR family)